MTLVGRKIRLTRTEVWEYVPNLSSDMYSTSNIHSLEEALEIDKCDVENGDVELYELADTYVSRIDNWEIVEADEER